MLRLLERNDIAGTTILRLLETPAVYHDTRVTPIHMESRDALIEFRPGRSLAVSVGAYCPVAAIETPMEFSLDATLRLNANLADGDTCQKPTAGLSDLRSIEWLHDCVGDEIVSIVRGTFLGSLAVLLRSGRFLGHYPTLTTIKLSVFTWEQFAEALDGDVPTDAWTGRAIGPDGLPF